MIFIATPCGSGAVSVCFHNSMLMTHEMLGKIQFPARSGVYEGGISIEDRRNRLSHEFSKTNATHLVFVDSDMKWEPNDFLRLVMHGLEVDVCGAWYPRKLMDWTKTTREEISRQTYVYTESGERVTCSEAVFGDRIRVNGLPTGFMMISRKVFEAMIGTVPVYEEDGFMMNEFFKVRILDGKKIGEDIDFCLRAEKLGFPLWKLCDVELGHEGRYIF